ncbi:DUF6702 family protein [Caulobacter sp. NIBR1757]|uniref:DUF6702 family protein n=1 Tax=Caulobacter sp. NIBR1757 TaxID=3016000 RepID=UPI0022F0F328|nr:DUF6702 family protein [Caulobacter sp. NIBR1757]WGM38540.1 hypothetical protein AMEJIAPC_01443 [Caulobacter sp. NIBR1757]
MRRLWITLAALLLALSGGGAALAHRGHATLSVVVIDAATGEVTVTHRMAAHDAEPALAVLAPDEQPSLDNDAAMDAFVAHLRSHFTVDGQTLRYERRDAEGDDLTLVYKGRMKTPVTSVVIEADLLPQVDADIPEFQVNVRLGKVTRTLLFRPGVGAQTAVFE